MTGPAAAGVAPMLERAADRLRAAGIANARSEARWLLAAALGVPSISEYGAIAAGAGVQAEFERSVERRSRREPLQHILGRAAFRFLDLQVGPGVFVPRPETELLVELVLRRIAGMAAPIVIDLCSGSGAIALAVATEFPLARVVAVERSPAALTWLAANRSEQPADVQARVEVVAADVADPGVEGAVRDKLAGASADVVVANPPYVSLGTVVGPEVSYDPAEAVFGGAHGVDLVPALSTLAGRLLRADGMFAMEHDETTATAVAHYLDGAAWLDVHTVADLAGRPRFVTARRASG